MSSGCTDTPDRAAGNTDSDHTAAPADMRIHTGMSRIGTAGSFHNHTRSSRADTRADVPCDEHPLRSLQ